MKLKIQKPDDSNEYYNTTITCANHRFNDEFNTKVQGFTETAMQAMLHYHWPGNIRELQNKLKSAVILADSKYISEDDLGLNAQVNKTETLRKVREQAETNAIRQAYTLANGNLSKTADNLGITRPTLYALIDKYRLLDLRNTETES